jgi:hypothetical protein
MNIGVFGKNNNRIVDISNHLNIFFKPVFLNLNVLILALLQILQAHDGGIHPLDQRL